MKRYQLYGDPVGHSFSPQLQEIIYQEAEIDAEYKAIQISGNQLKDCIHTMSHRGITGANITIPHKQAVIPLIDHLSEQAFNLQAVNTLKLDGDKILGFNTDYYGIDFTMKTKSWDPHGWRVYILGTGGAALTVAHYFKDQGAESVHLVSRRPAAFNNQQWPIISYQELSRRQGDLLVNATPVGMHPNVEASPVDPEIIDQFTFLFDLTYNPEVTQFLSYGQSLRKHTVNGLDMLIGQAIAAVEIWEEIEIDVASLDRIRWRVKEVVYS